MRILFVALLLPHLLFCTKPTTRELFYAAGNGDLQNLEKMVSLGADVNGKFHGDTPLKYAAKHGQIDAVKFLLKNKADVDARDDVKRTALMHAARNGNTAIVELLLEGGAAVDAVDNIGKTAMNYAASKKHHDIVNILLAKGAEIKDLINSSPRVQKSVEQKENQTHSLCKQKNFSDEYAKEKNALDTLVLTGDQNDYIIEQMKNTPSAFIIKPNVLDKLKSKKDVATFTREMITAMEFVKNDVKQLTEEVDAMSDQKIVPTNVIQSLLKRAKNQGKLNQQSVQQDVSGYKDLDLEKTEYAREFGIEKMVDTFAWLRNNMCAAYITDMKDAETTLTGMSDLLPELMEILGGKKKTEQGQQPQKSSNSTPNVTTVKSKKKKQSVLNPKAKIKKEKAEKPGPKPWEMHRKAGKHAQEPQVIVSKKQIAKNAHVVGNRIEELEKNVERIKKDMLHDQQRKTDAKNVLKNLELKESVDDTLSRAESEGEETDEDTLSRAESDAFLREYADLNVTLPEEEDSNNAEYESFQVATKPNTKKRLQQIFANKPNCPKPPAHPKGINAHEKTAIQNEKMEKMSAFEKKEMNKCRKDMASNWKY